MSSRRLLILLQHLPEESAFKAAYSGGDWPIAAQITTGLWNEIRALRTDMTHVPFSPILPPSAVRARDEQRAEMRAQHDATMAQLRGEKP